MTDASRPDEPQPDEEPDRTGWTPDDGTPAYPPAGGPPPGGGYQPPTGFPSAPQGPGGPTAPIPGATGPGGVLAGLGGRQNMLGVLSALAGFLSVVCCVCTSFGGGGAYFLTLILAIPAIVLGVMHVQQVNRGLATNKNLAYLGLALGILGLFIAVCGGISDVGRDLHNDVR